MLDLSERRLDKMHLDYKRLYYDQVISRLSLTLFDKKILGETITAYIGKDEAKILSIDEFEAEDRFGWHVGMTIYYGVKGKSQKKFVGKVRDYGGFVVFETLTEQGYSNKKKQRHKRPYICFPSFEGNRWDYECSMLSYKYEAPFNYPLQWNGEVVGSLIEGPHVPLIVTNKHYETVILAPLNQAIYNQVYVSHHPKAIHCGLSRKLKKVKSSNVSATIMVYGIGVNKTLDNYGKLMSHYTGVKPIHQQEDVLLSHLSYWTNAGSAYWYKTFKGESYAKTLKMLKEHHDQIGINFGSYQLDSWWYSRENETYTAGITNWEPKEVVRSKNFNSLLPFLQKYKAITLFDGLRLSQIQQLFDKPLGCHFKQLSSESVYIQDEEAFIMDGFAMPKNYKVAKSVFNRLFLHPKWHLSYVVHDWIQWMEVHHKAFRNQELVTEYFKALDDCLMEIESEENACDHITLQLCMTRPSMTLHASTMQSVTTIRSTCDSDSFFVEGTKRWWWHLYASRLIHTLGKYAFYDNRYTSKNHLHPFASYSRFEMIWLALLCGPIGIGDKIGKENVTLLKKVSCQDGRIIKPDYSAIPLDQCYLYNPHRMNGDKGVLVYTKSDVPSNEHMYPIYYTLAFSLNPIGKVVMMDYRVKEIVDGVAGMYAIYDYMKGTIEVVEGTKLRHYRLKGKIFRYELLARIEQQVAFLGDVSKHVAGSGQLIHKIMINKNEVIVKGVYPQDGESHWVFYSKRCPKNIRITHENSVGRECYQVGNRDYHYSNHCLSVKVLGEYNTVYELKVEF